MFPGAHFNQIKINPGANPAPAPQTMVIGGRLMELVKVDWLGRWVYQPVRA